MSLEIRKTLGLETIGSNYMVDHPEMMDEVPIETLHYEVVDDDEVDLIGSDIEAVQGYVDVLEESPAVGASPETLALAQIGLEAIFKKYGMKNRLFSMESYQASPAKETFETIRFAKEGLAEMLKAFGGALKNTFDRFSVNVKNAFRRRHAWTAEAMRLRNRLRQAKGKPDLESFYKNQIRIAHMTTGEQTVITDAAQMLQSVRRVEATMDGLSSMLDGIGSMYTIFNSEKGKVDFSYIAEQFEESKFSPDMLSLSGVDAIFGEEVTCTKFSGISSTVPEMMRIASGIKISHNTIWRVRDLEDQNLNPLAIEEMKRGIEDLVKTGQIVCDMYNRFDRDISRWVNDLDRKSQSEQIDIDLIVSPINYIRFNRTYTRLMRGCINTIIFTFDLNFVAATCLLEFWNWSLKHNR